MNRLCKTCGEWFPLTAEFFDHYKNRSRDGSRWNTGFRHKCKTCRTVWRGERIEVYKTDPEVFEGWKENRRQAWRRWASTEKGKETRRRCWNRPHRKIANNLRRRINAALRGSAKSGRTVELTGCSVEFLMNYLESKFVEGMNWDNYGFEGWHVDHIRPCASFDLTDAEQQRQCFNYTNLQPMWGVDNLSKGAKWNGEVQSERFG